MAFEALQTDMLAVNSVGCIAVVIKCDIVVPFDGIMAFLTLEKAAKAVRALLGKAMEVGMTRFAFLVESKKLEAL